MKNQILNPYLPLWEYVPDAEPRVFGDRLYIYGSHDFAGGEKGFCPGDYVVWSAPLADLSQWEYHGISYRRTDAPDMKAAPPFPGAGPDALYAPDVVQGPDGRYYLYYNTKYSASVGIAVSDHPEGPFYWYGSVCNPDGSPYEKEKMFDPGVLVDGDKVYLHTGFVPGKNYAYPVPTSGYSSIFTLSADMKTIIEGPKPLLPGEEKAVGTDFEGHGYYEAPSPRKIGSKYVLVYASVLSHELCYAVSDKPDSGYHFMGTLISNGDFGIHNAAPVIPFGNTHGGLVQLHGEWYIFYHRQTHGCESCRQGCAEKLPIRSDGWFGQAEITSCGLNPSALQTVGSYNACYCCHLTAPAMTGQRLTTRGNTRASEPHIFQEPANQDSNAQHYIANITDGTVAGFKYFNFSSCSGVVLEVAGSGNIVVSVHLDSPDGSAIGKTQKTLSGNWEEIRIHFEAHGTHALYFRFMTDAPIRFKQFIFLND